MVIPSPQEIGLPEQFGQWRPVQEEALRVMLSSKKRVKVISAPTGSGKSLISVAYALLTKQPTCIVTSSRGLQDQMMCVAPNTKICTGDLRWVQAQTVSVGDTLLGFDEEAGSHVRRFWKPSIVLQKTYTSKPCYRITVDGGTHIVCSHDHKWLVGCGPRVVPKWVETHDLVVGQNLSQVLDVWEHTEDYSTGYLSAAFEAEGSLYQAPALHTERPNGFNFHLSFAQLDNVMLKTVANLLIDREFSAALHQRPSGVCSITITRRREILRFLGEIRPERLLAKFDLGMIGMIKPTPTPIQSIQPLGVQDVIFLETSTRTFVAEGLASHNSNFKSVGMVDIRGRGNYECHMRDDYTCDEGHVARCPYRGSVSCPYSAAEMRAATSLLVTTSYGKWTTSRKFGLGMDHFKQVVFDEGEESVNAVGSVMQVFLYHKEIEETLGLSFLSFPESDDMMKWKSWASEARAKAELKMLQMRVKLAGVRDPKPSWVKHYTHMRLLMKRLAILTNARPLDWVVEELPQGFQFDPIRPGRYTEMALFLHIQSIVLISATIRPKTMYLLGQAKGSFDYWEFASDFDHRRCPIYYIPVIRVDYRTRDLSQLWLKLDQIVARRTDRKGIVQTVSFLRRDEVVSSSRFSSSMLINPQGEAPTEVLEQFDSAGPGTILVSPSVGSGYDFAFSKAEWQFVCKIPFPPPSKILKARTEADKEYPYYLAWNKLAQIFGRIMRDKRDQGESFICDMHMDWFIRYSYLAPKTFKMFLKQVDHVPPPPPKL